MMLVSVALALMFSRRSPRLLVPELRRYQLKWTARLPPGRKPRLKLRLPTKRSYSNKPFIKRPKPKWNLSGLSSRDGLHTTFQTKSNQ
ncbi:hypothetical protein DER45DRAFT_560665 [Fusarium avenaceum]|nr:hypothetical protein DER45DRAFT_560665 [Fusarium avenaceum]